MNPRLVTHMQANPKCLAYEGAQIIKVPRNPEASQVHSYFIYVIIYNICRGNTVRTSSAVIILIFLTDGQTQ